MVDVSQWAVDLAGSPWVFVALYAAATIDGFFPPVPSESVVIALSALSVSGGNPHLGLLAVVAAAGAFCGDQAAYTIGRRFPLRHLRVLRTDRARRAVTWAETTLAQRAAAIVLGGRFVPVGRVAVNVTAGSVGYPRSRFTALAAIAAVAWSASSVAVGVAAGSVLEEHPVAGAAVGVAAGTAGGVVVDRMLRRLPAARARRPAQAADRRASTTLRSEEY